MNISAHSIDIIQGNHVTPAQAGFINHWNQHYFGEVAVAKGLAKAPVHWRLLLRDEQHLLSHVAVTEMTIEMDGQRVNCGAVGGLFTPPGLQGKGLASALMDRAEAFIFSELKLTTCILFCLHELVPFYAGRGWSLVESPVTLEQTSGNATWGAAVMLLSADRSQQGRQRIHVPMKRATAAERTMIIFDADGTLIGGEPTDWASFEAAFLEVAGFALTSDFYDSIEEVTAKALVHQALAKLDDVERLLKEQAIAGGFLRRLKAAHIEDSACFPAVEGAVALLHDLKAKGLRVAIATGDWRESITFKLRAAGIPCDDIPIVTSSEHYSRADIIRAAVAEAGGSLNEAVYVGDGLWDLRACERLGIPFIGVGHRKERLRKAGALHVLDDLRPEGFWRARDAIHTAAI